MSGVAGKWTCFGESPTNYSCQEKKSRKEREGRPGLEGGRRGQNKASGLFAQLQDTQSSLKINVVVQY